MGSNNQNSPGRLRRRPACRGVRVERFRAIGGDAMHGPGAWTVRLSACRLAVIGTALGGIMPSAGAGQSARNDLADLGPGVTNHPMGVVPSTDITVPRDWPLSADGSITCLTCHESLPDSQRQTGLPLRKLNGARVEGIAFCAGCHDQTKSRSGTAMHWRVPRKAHTKLDSSDGPAGLFDAESRQCLSCHDGINATDSSTSTHRRRGGCPGSARNFQERHQLRTLARGHPSRQGSGHDLRDLTHPRHAR